MPELMAPIAAEPPATRTTSPLPCGSARPVGARRPWAGRLSRWLRSAAGALGPDARPEQRAIDELADVLARARDLGEVRMALVGLAGRVSGAARAELFRPQAGRSASPLASWPRRDGAGGSGPSSWAEHPGEPGPAAPKARREPAGPAPLRIDLRSAGEVLARLHLTAPGDRTWPPRVVRTLETLCSMAASAERGLGACRQAAAAEDEEGLIRGEPTLDALLRFTLAQSRRRHEPVSLLAISVDRYAAIRTLLGEGHAAEAVSRVARAVLEVLRSSDVVAVLDGGRLMAVLPTASADDAARLAEAVRSAISRRGAATETMPRLTATIGVAGYPDHAEDAASLRAAASSALTRAISQGHDRIVSLSPMMAGAF
ncbi:diguanylate cyclase domain-containing protein [Tundrisphaera sp. TA3]|uniref:diguanylate cyclase domain-containing protein n=1 Tax=Tundrisphaera sp. TA3 TaxID=3435775 RepID=UPI003EBFC458